MENPEACEDLSLLGGPLHRLGCRLGLVRGGTNTVVFGLVLGALPWLALLALALVEGLGYRLFSIEAIAAHVRLLVTIPLLFVCETLINPRFAAFVHEIARSQVVPASLLPALNSEIERITRWKDAWPPEAFLLVSAVLLALIMPNRNVFEYLSAPADGSMQSAVGATTWTSQWFWVICMTLFRFLWLRWLWRLVLWCFFLWRVSRLKLRLVPAHPDLAGGVGYLELVHAEFTPLVLAISAAQSASLAQDIASGKMAFDAIYAAIAFVLLMDAVLFLGPLYLFLSKLWACKVKGLSDYGTLAQRYVSEFDRKWLGVGAVSEDTLLGTADIQSLADLNNSVGIVRDMRLVPISPKLLMYLAVAALLPMLPLVLFKYPLADLLAKFIGRLSGL